MSSTCDVFISFISASPYSPLVDVHPPSTLCPLTLAKEGGGGGEFCCISWTCGSPPTPHPSQGACTRAPSCGSPRAHSPTATSPPATTTVSRFLVVLSIVRRRSLLHLITSCPPPAPLCHTAGLQFSSFFNSPFIYSHLHTLLALFRCGFSILLFHRFDVSSMDYTLSMTCRPLSPSMLQVFAALSHLTGCHA